jgi:2-methylcitrate dehydratase PrpD
VAISQVNLHVGRARFTKREILPHFIDCSLWEKSVPMVSLPPVSQLLADCAAATKFDDLPPQVVIDTQRAVLDWLGSAIAGALEPPARIVQQMVATLGISDEATVFGASRAAAASAALANGVASHILELDDVHKGSTLHPAAPIIPAALAVAEREHSDGKSFLLAVAIGYDVALRVGEAVNPTHYRFWHPTGTAATFGAAAAAGSLLKISGAQMLDALGSAGTQASGLWEFNADGAMSKHLHPGKAAFNGVLAADLARLGFTGATRILEGERGFFRATSEAFDASRVTDDLGSHWKISENCFKLYSCCGHTHSAIDTALDFRQQDRGNGSEALSALEDVHVKTYGPGYEIVNNMNPRSPYQAKFSLAYCVAAGLLEGWVGLDQFTPERFDTEGVRDEKIAALLKRVRVTVADDLTAKYPDEWGTRITFTLDDGSQQSMAASFPRGNPENAVSTAVLEDKFRTLVTPRYGQELAEKAIQTVNRLETLEDMTRAFADLT